MKSIYELKLHEQTWVCGDCFALRVPGGWLYAWAEEWSVPAFVPYSDEFDQQRVPPQASEGQSA